MCGCIRGGGERRVTRWTVTRVAGDNVGVELGIISLIGRVALSPWERDGCLVELGEG